jgi:electron transport complex protein RnfB
MVPAGRAWTGDDARAARIRHGLRNMRVLGEPARPAQGEATAIDAPAARVAPVDPVDNGAADADARKRAAIEDALARARARRAPQSR